jgi:hypothetical protein
MQVYRKEIFIFLSSVVEANYAIIEVREAKNFSLSRTGANLRISCLVSTESAEETNEVTRPWGHGLRGGASENNTF